MEDTSKQGIMFDFKFGTGCGNPGKGMRLPRFARNDKEGNLKVSRSTATLSRWKSIKAGVPLIV
jgi:hypothetical protein